MTHSIGNLHAPKLGGQTSSRLQSSEEEELKQFVAVVLGKSEDVWHDIFRRNGSQYREPTLVLFTDQVRSACGIAGAAVGPFYCPGDEKVYIDLAFYEELRRQFSAPGDFAQAYVIAHEVGHRVQKLLGITQRVDAMQRQMSEPTAHRNYVCAGSSGVTKPETCAGATPSTPPTCKHSLTTKAQRHKSST